MNSDLVQCIYCPARVDPKKGEGDHIIPAALGEFRGDKHFRRICVECNNKLSGCEQVLIRCGPERLYREIVVPRTPRSRMKRTGLCGAKGLPSPTVYWMHPEHGQLLAQLSSDTLESAELLDELVIRRGDQDPKHIRLFPDMTEQALLRKLEAVDLDGDVRISLHCSDAHAGKFTQLVKSVVSKDLRELQAMPPGLHKGLARFVFTFDDRYYQALAKIAFHYFLTHCDLVTGAGPGFADIRSFIMTGKPYLPWPKPFVCDRYPAGSTYADWMHLLAARISGKTAVALVRLFWGPKRHAVDHWVALGNVSQRIVLPHKAFAHSYNYFNGPPQGKYAGEVRQERVFRMN